MGTKEKINRLFDKKPPNPSGELRRKTKQKIDWKKPLKQMIINEEKNWQIEIDEKPFNPVRKTEEKNQS